MGNIKITFAQKKWRKLLLEEIKSGVVNSVKYEAKCSWKYVYVGNTVVPDSPLNIYVTLWYVEGI